MNNVNIKGAAGGGGGDDSDPDDDSGSGAQRGGLEVGETSEEGGRVEPQPDRGEHGGVSLLKGCFVETISVCVF